MKYFKRILLSIVSLISGYLFLALILSLISTNPEKLHCEENKPIFISTNRVHLDIIIPKEDLKGEIEEALPIDEEAKYVSFAWGDKAFYLETPTWNDLKPSTAARALLLNSESAMHITNYHGNHDDWVKLLVCEEQLELLKSYIMDSFERDEEGSIIEIEDSGYTAYDKFFEANGVYNCIRTCNSWVNKGLKEAKIKTSIWSPFDKGVLYQVERKRP